MKTGFQEDVWLFLWSCSITNLRNQLLFISWTESERSSTLISWCHICCNSMMLMLLLQSYILVCLITPLLRRGWCNVFVTVCLKDFSYPQIFYNLSEKYSPETNLIFYLTAWKYSIHCYWCFTIIVSACYYLIITIFAISLC